MMGFRAPACTGSEGQRVNKGLNRASPMSFLFRVLRVRLGFGLTFLFSFWTSVFKATACFPATRGQGAHDFKISGGPVGVACCCIEVSGGSEHRHGLRGSGLRSHATIVRKGKPFEQRGDVTVQIVGRAVEGSRKGAHEGRPYIGTPPHRPPAPCALARTWIPAFAGMTRSSSLQGTHEDAPTPDTTPPPSLRRVRCPAHVRVCAARLDSRFVRE